MQWPAVVYGITVGDGEIVSVALSQVSNAGGEPYWSWYGFDRRVWNGVPTRAAISKAALFPNLQAASTASNGLKTEDNGRTAGRKIEFKMIVPFVH